jgi:Bacterial Ig-like domain (group 1)
VYVTGNLSPVTVTVDASKEEDGAQVQIVNAGPNAVSLVSDSNLSLPFPYTLPGGQSSAVSLIYSAGAGKFTLLNPGATIDVSGGSPQSTTVNTPFHNPLQAIVKDGNGNPASGAAVTFTAPGSGPSATFGGLGSATAFSDSNGIATAPVLTANGQGGSYSVTASIPGAVSSVVFTPPASRAYNKAKHTASETFAVTNSSAQAMAGPLQLVVAGVPAGYTPVGNAGNLKGNPYWTVPNSTLLAPGAAASVTVTFAYTPGAKP